jgi:hypothetical protein
VSADNPGFISIVTVCEIGWVLAECYAADRARIAEVVKALLELGKSWSSRPIWSGKRYARGVDPRPA